MRLFKGVHAQTACIGDLSVLNRDAMRRKPKQIARFVALALVVLIAEVVSLSPAWGASVPLLAYGISRPYGISTSFCPWKTGKMGRNSREAFMA